MLDTIHLRRDSVIIFGLDWAIVKLQGYLDKKYKRLIEVGTYLFYIITITLLRDLQILSLQSYIDLYELVIPLFGFSKNFIRWIQGLFDSEKFTEVRGQRMLKHVFTCWISLQNVLIKKMEQIQKQ